MSDAVVVDSYAWVEYAEGSDEGEKAREYIEGSYELYTPAVVVAELSDRATREGMRDRWEQNLLPYMKRQTEVVPVTLEVAERAGEIKRELREDCPEVGLADAIILSVARKKDAKVLTGDPDFLVGAPSDEVIEVGSDNEV